MNGYEHTTGTFIGKGGTEIFYQRWIAPSPKAVIVLVHGMGEHSGRYMNIINEMKGNHISFYGLDHRGFGESGGERGHADSFMDYIYDVKLLTELIREEARELPLLMLGHSMGGVVAFKYALTYPEDIKGLILSAAGLIPAFEVPGWKIAAAKIFASIMPKLSMPSGLPPEGLSHDAQVVQDYLDDPLVHDKVTARWYVEFIRAQEECLNRALELNMPLLVVHGKEDPLVDYRGSERIYEFSTSHDKRLYLFDGLFHETMNEQEPDRKKVVSLIAEWINDHVGGKRKSTASKKSSKKKSAVKSSSKKTAAKKSTSKKTAKKTSAKKSSTKKATSKKTSGKKAASTKKTATKKKSKTTKKKK